MSLLILSAFHGGSHEQWCNGVEKFVGTAGLKVDVLHLPPLNWKSRMKLGALSLARKYSNAIASGVLQPPGVVLATDMMDLTSWLAITRLDVPHFIYFHENQMSMPWKPEDRDAAVHRRAQFGLININSAVCSTRVLFNSAFHMHCFLADARALLKRERFDDVDWTIDCIAKKSSVLYVGVDLSRIVANSLPWSERDPRLILWNHRWEYDKNFKGTRDGAPEAMQLFADRIIYCGFCESREEYEKWLCRCNALPVLSIHDFFGISVIEAIAAGCFPLLPNRLSYPEHIPEEFQRTHLYNSQSELIYKLKRQLIDPVSPSEQLQQHVARYDWSRMTGSYRKVLLGQDGFVYDKVSAN